MEAATKPLPLFSEYVIVSFKYVKEKRDWITEVVICDHPVKMTIFYSIFGNP